MGQRITREDARSALIRAGLSAYGERLDRLVSGLQGAHTAAAALTALKMGYRGPASFRAPEPADVQKVHGS